MTPSQAAFQLSHVWRDVCPNEAPYPIDARQIAEDMLGITVLGDDQLGDDFEAALFVRPKGKRIIYNQNIRQDGRKNFSIAHEIGHSSLHAGRDEFRCSIKDLTDMAPHPQNIEQEANLFAATLLMPADDFRQQMCDRPFTLAALSELGDERYRTTGTAMCVRLLELSKRTPLVMIRVHDQHHTVIGWSRNDAMKYTAFWLERGQVVPTAVVFHDPDGRQVDSALWLKPDHSKRWTLIQSAVHMPYYGQILILLHAERLDEMQDFEEPDPTPPSLPSFRK